MFGVGEQLGDRLAGEELLHWPWDQLLNMVTSIEVIPATGRFRESRAGRNRYDRITSSNCRRNPPSLMVGMVSTRSTRPSEFTKKRTTMVRPRRSRGMFLSGGMSRPRSCG